ncbi:unnamed protein product [Colias eurytheme]|nr:unnamed protein product [Colias eurytheme]
MKGDGRLPRCWIGSRNVALRLTRVWLYHLQVAHGTGSCATALRRRTSRTKTRGPATVPTAPQEDFQI